MKRLGRWWLDGLLVVACVILGSTLPGWAISQPSSGAPARNSAFTLLESGLDHVRILYRNPANKQYVRIDSSCYVGIPAGASYEINYLSWEYSSNGTTTDPEDISRSSTLSEEEFAQFEKSLLSAIATRVHEFQELDILKIPIHSLTKIADSNSSNISLIQLEFEIRWQEGSAPKAEAVSELDAGFNRLYRNLCINGEMAPSLRRKRILPENERTRGFHPQIVGYKEDGALINLSRGVMASRLDAVRIRVRETGMVAIRANDLILQGIPPERVVLDQVRIWHRGVELPVAIDESGDGVFGEGDAIIFFGQESDSEYTVDTQYFMTWSNMDTPPQRIEKCSAEWSESGASHFLSNYSYNNDRILVEIKSKMQYGWYTLEMDAQTKILDLDLPGIVEEGDVRLTLKAFNKSRLNKGFSVQIGDATAHFVSEPQINATTDYIVRMPASALLSASTMAIILDEEVEPYFPLEEGLSEKVGNVPHLFFDSIEILYPRRFILDSEGVTIERSHQSEEAQALVLGATGITGSFSAWILNATGEMIRYTADSVSQLSGFCLPQTDWQRMEVIQDADLPGPYTIDRDFDSSLHRRDQGYNLIMITPRFMAAKAAELARQRGEDGFEVLLVDVQDIYDEFNHGYPDCQAIKNFLRYAQSEWTGLSPEFVLLIGDCSWDHRDRTGYGTKDYLPTYAPLDNPMADASDEWYAYLWGGANDYFSDLIIGRISVQSVVDLDKYLTKVAVYESPKVGPWRARSTYITDDDDGTFERFAISNSEKSLPEQLYPHFIHQGDYPLVTNPYLYHLFMDSDEPGSEKYRKKKYCPDCAKAIIDEFDHGTLLLQYIGHGGNQLWSDERIFYGTDKPTSNLLEMKPNTRFPFVVSWSCLTGYLNFNIQPFTICLSEELLRYPDRGAIGMWGPSGSGATNKHMSLSKFMLRNFTLDGLDRLGETTTMTKIEFMQEENSPDLVNQYILFGDPTIRLDLPQENVPVSVEPSYFVADREQAFELSATLGNLNEGKAFVSMTLEGVHIYTSQPFDFSEGKIQHRFTAAVDEVSSTTAVIRFYAWNEQENRDAWGGLAIPKKSTRLELENATVAWTGDEATLQFNVVNASPFALQNVLCDLRIGDRTETVSAEEIAPDGTATIQWTGSIPPSEICAYVWVPADADQGIEATPEGKPLIIPLRILERNTIAPLIGTLSYSSKELVEGRLVRLQVPLRNFAEQGDDEFVSLALSGIGAATDVRDVTLAAGRERRLDFSITLPEPGDHQYVLSKRFGDVEQTYPISLTVQGKPDLALAEGDLTVFPEVPVIGKTVHLKTTVYNVGDGPASDIVIKAFDGDPSLKREVRPFNARISTTIERLEPGEMKEITIVWDPEAFEGLGTHEIHFVVDPQNRIDELSEDNNRSSVVLTLHDLPDLAVDKWTDHGFLVKLNEGIATWGQPINLLGRLRNIGDSDASYVRFTFLHNKKDHTHFFDLIPPNVAEETRVEVPLYASKNTLRIVADRYDLIAEKQEINNALDFKNNISEEQRIDFQLRMPLAPIINGRRIYRVTDEATFSAGKGEFLIYDEKRGELVLHPDLETVRYRVVPAFVQNQESYSLSFNNMQWLWNTKYNCFYSPIGKEEPLRMSLPAPNGIYDVSMHFFSAAYVDGKTERIRVKTPQDREFREIEHGEMENRNYLREISKDYHIRDDQFQIELRSIPGGISTSLGDIQFTRVKNDLPVSGGYLSPYFPADGSGTSPLSMSWMVEIPEGTELQFKARWVTRLSDGSFRFMPWARIVEGDKGSLQLPGKGDYFQYYVNFVRLTHDAATPKLREVLISIPAKEEESPSKETPSN